MEDEPDRRAGLALKAMRTYDLRLGFEYTRLPPNMPDDTAFHRAAGSKIMTLL